MPVLLVSRLKDVDSYPKIEIPYKIREKYPLIFRLIDQGLEVNARVYINRLYNESGEVTKEYKKLYLLSIEKAYMNYYIDFTYFHIKNGVPIGYIVDTLLINFVFRTKEGKTIETPVFPNEFLIEKEFGVPDRVSRLIDMERGALERIGKDVEVIGLLYDAGLNDIATDLIEALTRFYLSDYEGSIKFARKVIEGLRNLVKSGKIQIVSENRLKFLYEFLSKAYQLISNFGEHSGTYGFMPEAILSKEVAVSVCRYIVSYLRGV